MAEYVTGLERTQEYIDRLQGVLQFFETLPQEKRNPVQEAVVGLMLDHSKNVLDAAKNHKPLMCTWYGNCQEILAAMGVVYYTLTTKCARSCATPFTPWSTACILVLTASLLWPNPATDS